MTDPLTERLRAAAPTPAPVDVADLRRRAERTRGQGVTAIAVACMVVVTVAVLVRPSQDPHVELATGDPAAAVLASPPTGADPRLSDEVSGADVSELRLAMERDGQAVFVAPATDPALDVCLYVVGAEVDAHHCQQFDPSPLLAQVHYADPSLEVIAALVADGYTEALLADDRVVSISNNILLVSGPPPMVQGVTLRGPAGEVQVNLGASNSPTPSTDAVARVAEVCGPDLIGDPGAQAPETPLLTDTVIDVAAGTPLAEPFEDDVAYGLPPYGPPPKWWEWLRVDPIARFPDADLELVRIDGPNQGLCALLQSAASGPGARLVDIGNTSGIIANSRTLVWLAAPDVMLQLATHGAPIADDALIDIAGRVRFHTARDTIGPLPDGIGLAIRGDRRLDILTATAHTIYTDDVAFAPGDEPDSLALIDDTLISYGGDTYALTPQTAEPEQIGASTYFLPAGDHTAIWLITGNTSTLTPNTATLIEPDGTVLSGPHTLPENTRTTAAVGDGLLLSGAPDTGRAYWTPQDGAQPIDVGENTIASRGDRFATCHNRCSQLTVYTTPDNLIAAPGALTKPLIGTGAFSSDGHRLALATGTPETDVDVLIMDLERAQSYSIDLAFDDVPELGFGPDGQLVAIADGEIVVVDGQDSVTHSLPEDVRFIKDAVVMDADLADRYHR